MRLLVRLHRWRSGSSRHCRRIWPIRDPSGWLRGRRGSGFIVIYISRLLLSLGLGGSVATYHRTVSDLNWFKDVHHCLCGFAGDEVARAGSGCVVHLPSQVDGVQGCDQVGDNSCHAEPISFLWDVLEGECLLDDCLREGEDTLISTVF